ncbi:hypothetical protein JF535_13170 [Microbulbifer salipaludis]|uniref:Uncharacterized protein n=1 Tax=Microbulbifer salipaludis TaxID=187980 RepID=A0ABS3E913_9GAMM|nr:hypothetical protein [Microbulbifer salipaludis]MBN8431802.1 hypothetical protein [Microbulbifer salipaludis]
MRNNSETFDLYNQNPQRALRLVVVIEFPTPVYLASHGDIPGLPAGALAGVLAKVSSTSQRLQPEAGRAEIGAINFELVDVGGVFTDTLRNQLQAGNGLKGRTVRLYQGGAGMDWADFRLEQTQVAEESLGYDHGRYRVRCRDIQREMRKDIFVPRSTRLAADFAKGASTLSVYSTADFEPCPHTSSFGDAPGQTVYYLKIKYQNGWEVVRATGKTGTSFTGVTRGLFGTVEYDHTVPTENDDDKGIEVEEFIYLELPAPALAYALLTGNILGTSDVLPSNWHLGIDPAHVVADEFENVGADWYKPGDYAKGVILRFDGLTKTDGKKFIEQEINLLLGAYMPVNAAGQLGFRRMTGVLADAGTVATITADDVVSLGELQQDLAALRNIFSIQWAWYEAPGFDGRFLRSNVLADADSIAHHGESKPQALKFKGLHNSRHTFTTLKNRFDALRDRFAGPPLRLRLSLLPSNNDIEVGDVVRVTLPQVRDYTSDGTLDRAMEVQRVSVDQVSGGVQVELFGSTQKAAPIADEAASTSAELPDGWYSTAGTEMTAAGLTIDGSGFLTADGTLQGAASSRTIFYYLGDLTIPAGRTLFVADNVELRVMGVLQIEGTLRGVPSNSGAGFIGSCRGGGGRVLQDRGIVRQNAKGEVVKGRNEIMPPVTIDNDGGELLGIPADLRGSGGASGGTSYQFLNGDNSYEPTGFGGSGGQGGAGVVVVARGIALGVAGAIDTSGGDGQPGSRTTLVIPNGPYGGSGGGGAPGGVLLIVDGHQNPQPVLTNSKLVACYGDSPNSPGNAGTGGSCLGVNAARVYTVPKSRTPYPNYAQDPEIDPALQQALAEAQQAAQDAADAQADATAALADLDDIAADGKLHPSEKLRAVLEYNAMSSEQAGITASATTFGITSEKTAYTSAVNALTSYLNGLTPDWDNTGTTTSISRTLWNSNWQAVYDARQALLNKIADIAGLRADWAQIGGAGKPEDGATKNLLSYDEYSKQLLDDGNVVGLLESLASAKNRMLRTAGAGFNESFIGSNSADDWEAVIGTARYRIVEGDIGAISGGNVLRMGGEYNDLDVDGNLRLHYRERFPFDPEKTYRIEVRAIVFNEGDLTRTIHLGLCGYDKNGDLMSRRGLAENGYQHYFAADSLAAAGDSWQTYVAYVRGHGDYYLANGINQYTQEKPGQMHPDVRYFAPLIQANREGTSGRVQVDYFRVDIVDEAGRINLLQQREGAVCLLREDFREENIGVPTETNFNGGAQYTFSSEVAARGYIHALLRDAENGVHVGLNDEELGVCAGPNNATKWYTFEVDIVAGTNTVSIWSSNTDGATIYGVVAVAGGAGDPQMWLEGQKYAHGCGLILNASTFTNQGSSGSDGELYIHGYDAKGAPQDVDGWIVWNSKRVPIPRHQLNPSRIGHYLIVVRLNTSGNGLNTFTGGQQVIPVYVEHGVYRYRYYDGSTQTIEFTPNERDLVIGEFYADAGEHIESGGMYQNPRPLLGFPALTSGLNMKGRAVDQRTLPMVQSDLASIALSSVCTAVDAGSTATINIAAHDVQFGGFTVAYNSASITGLQFVKKYYVYCDDEDFAGGAVTYHATTNWATAKGSPYRRLVDVITTPSDGGSSSGGGWTPPDECVCADMWLLDGLQAADARAGDLISVWEPGDQLWHGPIKSTKLVEDIDCVRLVTESGAEVHCSTTAPVTDRDGVVRRAPDTLGTWVGVSHHGSHDVTWERITRVEPIGQRAVCRIKVGGISYAAGRNPAHRIITHNPYYKP